VSAPPLIDGRLDDGAWQGVPATDEFTQQYPFDGQKPSERTLMRVVYDDEAIYFGFDCEQVNTPIVERLTRRDRDSESEWVWVQIDSRNEGKSAFMFAVNISGTLADGQIIDQTTYSWEWDENWEARTMRRANGWSAEIRIPIRTLRFDGSAAVQSWGLQAARFVSERQETALWAYFPRDVPTPLAYLGRLDDLRGLKGGGALELLPFGVGYTRRRDADETTLGSGFRFGGSVGLNLKWHLAHDITLDAAFNPDFAQVEADQVILNLTNFETFLPEKRPFFLEGIDAFSFPLQVFYSRRIGSAPLAPTLGAATDRFVDVPLPATIYAAGKLVGRLGPRWTMGAMSAITAANEVTVENMAGARSTVLAAPTTAWNVLRLKRELGGAGHIGLIGTGASRFENTNGYPPDPLNPNSLQLCPAGQIVPQGNRCFRGAYLGGFDGRWRSTSQEYMVGGAFVQSYIHGGPVFVQPDGTPVGAGATSPGGWLRIAKEGGPHLLWSAEYTGAGRTLQYNDVGYMARQNLHSLKGTLGWRTLEADSNTVEKLATLEVSDNRNLSGLDLGQLYEVNGRVRLRNFSSIFVAADFGPSRFDDREVGNGTALQRARFIGGKLELATDPRGFLYATLANQTQLVSGGGFVTNTQGTILFHALRQFDIELLPQITWSAGEYRYARQSVTSDIDPYYFGKLRANSISATLRASYTFTPQLTLQAYAQAFLASGHFEDIRLVTRGSVTDGVVHLSELAVATPINPMNSPGFVEPDFEDAALNVNVVFRWEYRLGSTIYFVYARSQIPTVSNFVAPGMIDFKAFGHGGSSDVFLLKFSYWWAG